jgi:hypothetical protein
MAQSFPLERRGVAGSPDAESGQDRYVTAGPLTWDPERLIHRQTYIDLIRAYLRDYGSQHDLARALGLSEAYASYLLAPLRLGYDRRPAHWTALLTAHGDEVAEAFRFVKTPSLRRARQIADLLCTDAERREVLLHHIELARRSSRCPAQDGVRLSEAEAGAAVSALAELHHRALHDTRPALTAVAYARVWSDAMSLSASIDPRQNPVGYAQVLMFRHDAAQVLGRADIALGCARKAIAILQSIGTGAASSDDAVRMTINSRFAEIVSLNTLGLRNEARVAIATAEPLRGYRREPQTWLRSFLEEQLNSITGFPRASIYGAERTADMALALVPDDAIVQAGVTRRLMDIYLARPTGRNRRKADRLAGALRPVIASGSAISPLRRAQILRTLARYSRSVQDTSGTAALISEGLRVTADAHLVHQRRELVREFSVGQA